MSAERAHACVECTHESYKKRACACVCVCVFKRHGERGHIHIHGTLKPTNINRGRKENCVKQEGRLCDENTLTNKYYPSTCSCKNLNDACLKKNK